MRKAGWIAASFLAVTVATGCSGNGDSGTLLERANGSWKYIATPTDNTLDRVTVADGKVTAKGGKLSCTGTMSPTTENDKEEATITYTCEQGGDGGRGIGHLTVDSDDYLIIEWEGPVGGFGGPLDSYRRA
ncbi:hypothetical protein [Streptomyces mobaraensis]|uniref:Lipoprotein n=1 Tax=Streptomyces mobaraensis TaxID=35621 RepID=A0A5N5W1K7_STRMB|nr:hypothetical protein [Streptomyces mobaraensis]KAB7835552.1 hypothetical protein FRZ00_27075 [Streptomyces mobaraensis]